MKHILVAVIFLLAWFLIVAPVTFSQTVYVPFGDALVSPDTGTTIMPLQPDGRMGVILDDRGGLEPYTILTPPSTSLSAPALPTLPAIEPYSPAPLYEPVLPLTSPYGNAYSLPLGGE